MREQQTALPLGGLPWRKFFLFLMATFLAFFALVAPVSAQSPPANAEWKGDAITYNGNQFISIKVPTNPDGSSSIPGIPADAKAYAFVEQSTSGTLGTPQKAHIIYFAPGADPPTATTASYVTYIYSPPASYSNPSGGTTINITPQSSSTKTTTSCDSGEVLQGIGWIVCPATKFLAGAMDWLFKILSDFLAVRPVQTGQDNALFKAWSIMRNFANVIFIIGFLVVIYSQVTSIGLSNYSLKKIFPRLLIAAILVNISYWICAVAVDASNILGYSIQDLFIAIRNSLVTEGGGNSWDVVSWQSVTGFILSGGAVATGAGIGLYALAAGSVAGAIYMLLPILVGVLVAVLVALLVIAARQAIITVLIVISPLAFVAYLLPNTEKHFNKWRELFTTMLFLFPIFSIIFGGSQLAGTLIIQNANSINLLILGMAVQVAPVVITPLLVRFSGSLIGRIAGMVNNPNKGLIDRTRNWAREQADEAKSRTLANNPKKGIRGFMARRTHNIDHRRRKGKAWKEAHDSYADARWANSDDYRKIHGSKERADMIKEMGEARAQAHINQLKLANGNQMQIDEVNLRIAKAKADLTKAQTDVQWENLRSAESSYNVVPAELARRGLAAQARSVAQESMVTSRQLHSAQHEQTQDFAKALQASDVLQKRAGGISKHGADAALAAAITTTRKAYGESISEAEQIIKHFNLSNEKRQDLALGRTVDITDPTTGALIKRFDKDSLFAREAAIDMQIKYGTISDAQEIIERSGGELKSFVTSISGAVKDASLGGKTIYLGGSTVDEISQGKVASHADLIGVVQNNIARGKVAADKLVNTDKDALNTILEAAQTASTSHMDATLVGQYPASIQDLKKQAEHALTDPLLSPRLAANQRAILEKIKNLP